MTTTRQQASFRFPKDKYEDELALYENMRYLQEYLRNLRMVSTHAYDVIVKPSDSSSNNSADLVLTGTGDMAAINAAITAGARSFFFLPGTIAVDAEGGIVAFGGDFTFVGSGLDVTTFLGESVAGAAEEVFMTKSDGGVVTMRDFTYDANGEGERAFNTNLSESAWGVQMFNVRITNCDTHALEFQNSGTPRISVVHGCIIDNNGDAGIKVLSERVVISNCLILNNGENGVDVSASAGFAIVTDNFINGNTLQSVTTASSGDALVVGNWIDNNGTDEPDGTVVGLNFVNGAIGVSSITLDSLSDVVITGPVADNELFAYNSGTSTWINQTPDEAGLEEYVEDTVGGMVTGNTETGITVTYEDSDGTLDFVVSDEFIADTVGAMVTGNTETGIAVTYDDTDNTLDFVLDSEITTFFANTDITGAEAEDLTDGGATTLHTHAAPALGDLSDVGDGGPTLDDILVGDGDSWEATPGAEYVSDIVGTMVTGNTETGISVTYQDADNTLDFVLDSEITTFFANTDITGAEAEDLTDGGATTLHTHAAPALGDLSDVGVGTPTAGNLLEGDGDSWESVLPGSLDAADFGSGAASDGHVLTADGSGGAAWEAVAASGEVGFRQSFLLGGM